MGSSATIILDSRGLEMRKNGNVIQVAPREELATKEKLNLTANQEIFDLAALQTESFRLTYSKGVEIVALLQNPTSPTQRMLSKRGSAVVDARTNTVFVQDTPSRLEVARRLIKQVDVAVRHAESFSAITFIAASGGPTKISPARRTAAAKSAFSDKKP